MRCCELTFLVGIIFHDLYAQIKIWTIKERSLGTCIIFPYIFVLLHFLVKLKQFYMLFLFRNIFGSFFSTFLRQLIFKPWYYIFILGKWLMDRFWTLIYLLILIRRDSEILLKEKIYSFPDFLQYTVNSIVSFHDPVSIRTRIWVN